MDVTVSGYLLLLAVVGFSRLMELRVSRRNQRRLEASGAHEVRDPSLRWMVAFHTLMLLGAAVEVVVLDRPLIPWMACLGLVLFVFTNLGRWWVIQTLGVNWTVRVVGGSERTISAAGPFRWVRHPNYAFVFVEMIALPLIHTAMWTLTLGTIAHVFVLRERVRVEESALALSPEYMAEMGAKPRFVPGLF
jgi:methyltransferase